MNQIKFCENNFTHGTEDVVDKLKLEHPEAKVKVESCLGFCGDCAEGPFAILNDELIQADSAEELYEAICDNMDE